MKYSRPLKAFALGTAVLLSGCSSTGTYLSAHLTDVELSQPNYRIVATNVSGSAKSGYVLGVSVPMGERAGTFAMFRVSGTGMLYPEAMADLWKNYAASHGSPENRKLALTNVRYDTESLNLLLYTSLRVNIQADVVEFESGTAAPENPTSAPATE